MQRNLITGVHDCCGLRKWQEIPYSDIDYPIQKICMNCPIKSYPYNGYNSFNPSNWRKLNYLSQQRCNKKVATIAKNKKTKCIDNAPDITCKSDTLRRFFTLPFQSTFNCDSPDQTSEQKNSNKIPSFFYNSVNYNQYATDRSMDAHHFKRITSMQSPCNSHHQCGYLSYFDNDNTKLVHDFYGNPLYLKQNYFERNGPWFRVYDRYARLIGWYFNSRNKKHIQMKNWIKNIYKFYNNIAGAKHPPLKSNQFEKQFKPEQISYQFSQRQQTHSAINNIASSCNEVIGDVNCKGVGQKAPKYSRPSYEPFNPAKIWECNNVSRPISTYALKRKSLYML